MMRMAGKPTGWVSQSGAASSQRGPRLTVRESPRLNPAKSHTGCVRICVIFNPMAKGSKARKFRAGLDKIGSQASLKMTRSAWHARTLSAEAVAEGFECIVAAGGDGTLNEVLNGIGRAPKGFESVALGVLPLGTVNVYARELGIPLNLEGAWKVILAGKQRQLDLGCAKCGAMEAGGQQWFAQLAGAGLDARAIQLVDWHLKIRLGPLAYVVAGLKALRERKPKIVVSDGRAMLEGELVLVGNGSLYGGNFKTFDTAAMDDGLLDVCVFPKVNLSVLASCAGPLLLKGRLPEAQVRRMKAAEFTLASSEPCAFELDGELAGQLPVKFAVARRRLRVLVP